MNLDKVINIIRNLNEEPTNSAGSGAIAGLPPDEPPVRKKKRKETPVGRYGSRRMWLQDLKDK
jgi:hypothetical protein